MRRIRSWKHAQPSLYPSLAGLRPMLVGCLILAAGFIHHTGDGGAAWNHCAIFAFAANHIASGDPGGVLARTCDGGLSWQWHVWQEFDPIESVAMAPEAAR